MRRFIIRGLVFLMLALAGLELIAFIRIHPLVLKQFPGSRGWFRVEERISRSKQKIPFKRVYLGDSVGNQLYGFDTVPNSLTANAAVTMAGNYILLQNHLRRNPQIEEVVMIFVPNDIGFYFERKLTYQNFVKPFYIPGNLSCFEPLLFTKLMERPVSLLSLFRWYKILPVSDINFSNTRLPGSPGDYVTEMRDHDLSDLSVLYLKKISQLCKERSVRLILVSPPVPDYWKNNTQDWFRMRKQIEEEQLTGIFGQYLDQIDYLPATCFADSLHLVREHVSIARTLTDQKIHLQSVIPFGKHNYSD